MNAQYTSSGTLVRLAAASSAAVGLWILSVSIASSKTAQGSAASTSTAAAGPAPTYAQECVDRSLPVADAGSTADLLSAATAACQASGRTLGTHSWGYDPEQGEVLQYQCCRNKLVSPTICRGDTSAPRPAFGGGRAPWELHVRPVRIKTVSGGGWVLAMRLSEVVTDGCEVLFGSASGQVTWPNTDGKRLAVPFFCPATFKPVTDLETAAAIVPITLPPKQMILGRRMPGAIGSGPESSAPCLAAIPDAETANFEAAMASGQASFEGRVDVYDANKNHLGMAFATPTFGSAGFTLSKTAFNQPTTLATWPTQPAAHACAAGRFPASMVATATLPQVSTAVTLHNPRIEVRVPATKLRAGSQTGTVCASQPSVTALLVQATVLRRSGSEVLASPAQITPCALDAASGDVVCTLQPKDLQAEPGMTLRATVSLIADLGTEFVSTQVHTP